MITKFRNLLIAGLFLIGVLFGTGFAQEEPIAGKNGSDEATEEEDVATDYGASDSVAAGRQIILEQKEKLQEKKRQKVKSEEEALTTEAIKSGIDKAKQEIYIQEIIQEVSSPRPAMAGVEIELQREKYRRELMKRGGEEIRQTFKRKEFNMRVSETYDDNIFLEKNDAKKDYITKVSPSALFALRSRNLYLDANYVMDLEWYKRNHNQNGLSHMILLYLRPKVFKIPFLMKHKSGKLGLEIQDRCQPQVTDVASSEQNERTARTYNHLFMALDYYMSTKRTLALEYRDEYQHYRQDINAHDSYADHRISPTFYFNIRPKWSLFTGYEFGLKDYPKWVYSSHYQRARAGITGKVFTKGLGHIEVGNEWRVYNKKELYGSPSKMFARVALLNRFGRSTAVSLDYKHRMEESIYTNNTFYMTDSVDFDLEHKFTAKTTGILGMLYVRNTYDNPTTENGTTQRRRDDLFGPNIGLRYSFGRGFYADINYMYTLRTSNFNTYDYQDNEVTVGVNKLF